MTPSFRLLLITDRRVTEDLVATVTAALTFAPAGAVAVMLREKDLPGRALLALARRLRAVTAATGAALLVNDRVDVALEAGADGVHLPAAGIPVAEARRRLGPERLVGVSTHGAAEVAAAAAAGADYATFGPVFDTPSKRRYGPPPGLEALAAAAREPLPLYGLGGVDPGNADAVRAAGAAGVACIRAVLAAADPAAAVAALLHPAPRATAVAPGSRP